MASYPKFMEISSSDVIATGALVVSFFAALYARKQSEIGSASFHVARRAHLSEYHDRYRTLLTENKSMHRDELRSLSRLSTTTMNNFIELFDSYDNDRENSVRPLRHLIHEASELVFYSFKGQMNWQTGLNLQFRFSQFSRIEENLSPENSFLGDDFRRQFESMYRENPNCSLERQLLSDKYFCALINQLKQRIDKVNGGQLLLEQQVRLNELIVLWNSLKPAFEASNKLLTKNLEENSLDQFSLEESPKIYQEFCRWSAKLDILSNLRFHMISEEFADRYQDFISICIYNCSLLHALQDVESWGWSKITKTSS